MELTYLYYFKVIAEKENMSRAAETLHVSQPALSKTISKLETSLGVTLFERKKGRISLSPHWSGVLPSGCPCLRLFG